MLRIISLNVNGLRSAAKKGFFDWFADQSADIVCLQEIKVEEHQLDDPIFSPRGYYRYMLSAEKKGYSGVAIYTRIEPLKVHYGLGWALADTEGRYIQIDFPKFSVASVYLPSGASGEERQVLKYEFMEKFGKDLDRFQKSNRDFIICGDINIVHKAIDIKNWKSNQKNSGCLPEERAWLNNLLEEKGWVDTFRVLNQLPEQYTWWSNRGQARDKNVGWRIDYQLATAGFKDRLLATSVYKDTWFSDHAPLTVDYEV